MTEEDQFDNDVTMDLGEDQEGTPEEEYEVEAIIDEVKAPSQLYRVKWQGYGLSGCTWEPYDHLELANEAITVYQTTLDLQRKDKVRIVKASDKKMLENLWDMLTTSTNQNTSDDDNDGNNNAMAGWASQGCAFQIYDLARFEMYLRGICGFLDNNNNNNNTNKNNSSNEKVSDYKSFSARLAILGFEMKEKEQLFHHPCFSASNKGWIDYIGKNSIQYPSSYSQRAISMLNLSKDNNNNNNNHNNNNNNNNNEMNGNNRNINGNIENDEMNNGNSGNMINLTDGNANTNRNRNRSASNVLDNDNSKSNGSRSNNNSMKRNVNIESNTNETNSQTAKKRNASTDGINVRRARGKGKNKSKGRGRGNGKGNVLEGRERGRERVGGRVRGIGIDYDELSREYDYYYNNVIQPISDKVLDPVILPFNNREFDLDINQIHLWTEYDVGKWLLCCGIWGKQYINDFIRNGIDGRILLEFANIEIIARQCNIKQNDKANFVFAVNHLRTARMNCLSVAR